VGGHGHRVLTQAGINTVTGPGNRQTASQAPARTAAPPVGRFDQLDPQHRRRGGNLVTGQPAPRHPARGHM